jgi:hypothetical protein
MEKELDFDFDYDSVKRDLQEGKYPPKLCSEALLIQLKY